MCTGPCLNDGGSGKKISKKSHPSLGGTYCEVPSEEGKQLGDDVDSKDNDNEYYKEPSIRSSKRSWNFFKLVRNRIKHHTHNKRQQGVYDKQSFVQSTEEGSQEREGTSTRQREAKAYPHQEKPAIVKSKIARLSKPATITSHFCLPLFVIAPAGFWPRRRKERKHSNNNNDDDDDDDDDDTIYMS